MKFIIAISVFLVAASAQAAEYHVAANEQPQMPPDQASIIIDMDALTRTYDRMIFGGFLEHFDNQIYGGVFDPGSPLADALFTASFLNACIRHSDIVTMANIAPLVNTRGPLFVHPKGLVKRTHFHARSMYSNLLQPQVVPAQIESKPLEGAKVSTIDAVATVDESGKRWSIAIINRHPSRVVRCALDLKGTPLDGTFKATVLTSDSPDSYNDIKRPDRVMPHDVELIIKKGIVNLPPHSLTILDVSAESVNQCMENKCFFYEKA